MKPKYTFVSIMIVLLVAGMGGRLAYAQSVTPQVGFFEAYEVQPGGRIEVPVEVRGVKNLFGIDIEVAYDPSILAIEDADPEAPGVQPALGTFLDAGLMVYFEIDQANGLARLAMSQVNPSEPKSGDGVIMVLYLMGLQEGESQLVVNFAELATRFGEEILAEKEDSVIVVLAAALEAEATPIPVQDPTLIIPVLTLAETPPATLTLTPEPTHTRLLDPTDAPAPTDTAEPATAVTDEVAHEQDLLDEELEIDVNETAPEEDSSGFSIVQYWWAVLIVFLLAAGVGIYLWVNQNRPS